MRASSSSSSSFSARSLASVTAAPSSSRARALTLVATSSRKRQELQPFSSIAAAARVASSDNASTSSSSSPLPSSSSSAPSSSARNFAVLAAAVAGLAAFGGAAAPHAAAALIDAAGVDASASMSMPLMLDTVHHLHASSASASPLLMSPPAIGDLADSEDFWSNLLRYVSFYFSVLLGTAATAARPVEAALKRSPASAAGVVVAALVLGIFVTKTVGAMLGVDDGSPDDLTAFLNSGME